MLNKKYLLLLLLFLPFANACDKDNGDDSEQIPNVPVSLVVNMALPAYFDLQFAGHYMYFDGGHKGILLYHGFDDYYYAFDRSCTYQPYAACSRLWVDSSNTLSAVCGTYTDGVFEKCCDSRFELPSGFPNQSPARVAMKQYSISKNGDYLYVTN